MMVGERGEGGRGGGGVKNLCHLCFCYVLCLYLLIFSFQCFMTWMTWCLQQGCLFLSGTQGEDACGTIKEIHEACRDIGFLYLTGHGMEKATMDKMMEKAWTFFALPIEKKMALRIPENSPIQPWLGYVEPCELLCRSMIKHVLLRMLMLLWYKQVSRSCAECMSAVPKRGLASRVGHSAPLNMADSMEEVNVGGKKICRK